MNMVSELKTDMQTFIDRIPDLRSIIPDLSTVIHEVRALKEAMASQQARLNLLEEEFARDIRNLSSEKGVDPCSVSPLLSQSTMIPQAPTDQRVGSTSS